MRRWSDGIWAEELHFSFCVTIVLFWPVAQKGKRKNVEEALKKSVYIDRTVGGYCDHCCSDRFASASRSASTRSRSSHSMHKQFQAIRVGSAQLPRRVPDDARWNQRFGLPHFIALPDSDNRAFSNQRFRAAASVSRSAESVQLVCCRTVSTVESKFFWWGASVLANANRRFELPIGY